MQPNVLLYFNIYDTLLLLKIDNGRVVFCCVMFCYIVLYCVALCCFMFCCVLFCCEDDMFYWSC